MLRKTRGEKWNVNLNRLSVKTGKMPDKDRWFLAAGAAGFMVSVSLVLWACGYDGQLQFNKGLLSLVCFGIGIRWIPLLVCHWKQNRRRFGFAYGISVILMGTELLGLWLWRKENTGLAVASWKAVLGLFFCAWMLACILEPFFYALTEVHLERTPEEKPQSSKRLRQIFIGVWAALMVAYLPCLLAFYPGLYCYDMSWQWQQFIGGVYTTHHPLIHTVLSAGLIEIGRVLFGSYEKGLFLHSIVQLLIMTGSMAFAIRFLVKWNMPKKIWIVTGVFFVFYPFFPVLGISTTKDIVFGCLFLMVFVCICDMEQKKRMYTGWRLSFFYLLSIVTCLFRNNMVYGLALIAAGVLAVLIMRSVQKKSCRKLGIVWGLIVLIVIGSHFSFSGLETMFHAQKGSKAEMLSLPMQQMARVYVRHTEEMNPRDRLLMEQFFEKNWLVKYKYYVSDPVKAGMDMQLVEEKPGEFIKMWARLGRQFPAEYLEAPLYNTFGLWYLGGDSSCYVEYQMSQPFDEEHAVELRSKFPAAQAYYKWFQDQNLHRYLPGISVIFYTSFYMWVILICGWYLLAAKRYEHAFAVLFLLAYAATLVFAPCILPRYFLGLILSTPVLIAITFVGSIKGEDHVAVCAMQEQEQKQNE